MDIIENIIKMNQLREEADNMLPALGTEIEKIWEEYRLTNKENSLGSDIDYITIHSENVYFGNENYNYRMPVAFVTGTEEYRQAYIQQELERQKERLAQSQAKLAKILQEENRKMEDAERREYERLKAKYGE